MLTSTVLRSTLGKRHKRQRRRTEPRFAGGQAGVVWGAPTCGG